MEPMIQPPQGMQNTQSVQTPGVSVNPLGRVMPVQPMPVSEPPSASYSGLGKAVMLFVGLLLGAAAGGYGGYYYAMQLSAQTIASLEAGYMASLTEETVDETAVIIEEETNDTTNPLGDVKTNPFE